MLEVFEDTGTLWESVAPDARRPGEPAQADRVQADRVAVGQEAPGFALVGTDDKTYAPGDLRGARVGAATERAEAAKIRAGRAALGMPRSKGDSNSWGCRSSRGTRSAP